jgi:hypothetical protein
MTTERTPEGQRFETILTMLSSPTMPKISFPEADGIMKLFTENELMLIFVLSKSGTSLNAKQVLDILVLDLYQSLIDKKHEAKLWPYNVSAGITDTDKKRFEKIFLKYFSKVMEKPIKSSDLKRGYLVGFKFKTIEAIRKTIVETGIAQIPSYTTIKRTLDYLCSFGFIVRRETAFRHEKMIYALSPRFYAIVRMWEGKVDIDNHYLF